MTFRGFPPAALEFYRGLEADNSKAYWQANAETYRSAVREPMEGLLAELDEEFGPFHLFRPYRDVRFSADKTPYKTQIAALGEREGGAMCYVALGASGLMAGSGYYAMAGDQLERFRAAVDDDQLGPEVEALAGDLERLGYQIGAIGELKTAPRGYPRDHPRIDLLRRKGLMAARTFPPARWLSTAAAVDRVRDAWRDVDPLNDWLDRHVGPSTLAPEER